MKFFLKTAIKSIIIKLRMQKMAYAFFNIYAYFFRHQTVVRDGITYSLDLRESVDRGIFLLGWEPLTISWLNKNLKTGDVVIEVGGKYWCSLINHVFDYWASMDRYIALSLLILPFIS